MRIYRAAEIDDSCRDGLNILFGRIIGKVCSVLLKYFANLEFFIVVGQGSKIAILQYICPEFIIVIKTIPSICG